MICNANIINVPNISTHFWLITKFLLSVYSCCELEHQVVKIRKIQNIFKLPKTECFET